MKKKMLVGSAVLAVVVSITAFVFIQNRK